MLWLLRKEILVEWWNAYHVILFVILGLVAAWMLVVWVQSMHVRVRMPMMPWKRRRMQRESEEQWERIRAHAAKGKVEH